MPNSNDPSFDDATLMLGLMQESFVRLARAFAVTDPEDAMDALHKIEAACIDDVTRLARERVIPPNVEALAAILRHTREMIGAGRAACDAARLSNPHPEPSHA